MIYVEITGPVRRHNYLRLSALGDTVKAIALNLTANIFGMFLAIEGAILLTP